MSESGHRSCKCGAAYDRSEHIVEAREISSFECAVCGETIENWNSTWVPRYRFLDSAPPYWPHGIAALLSPAFAKLLDLPKCYHNTRAKAGRDQHEKKVQIGKRAHKLESSQRARTASIA
jgi:hypothetical protein